MYFLKAPLEILRRLRVPETPPASVLCASRILNLVLSFATIPTSCLVRLLWTPGCFFFKLQPLPRLLCVSYFNQKMEKFGFHSEVSSLQAAPPWPLLCLFLPNSLLQDALVCYTPPENFTVSYSSPVTCQPSLTGLPLCTESLAYFLKDYSL